MMNTNFFLIILLVLSAPQLVTSQEIKENKVDEFTNDQVVRTSWEKLHYSLKITSYARISKINEFYFFDFKGMAGRKVFSVSKGQEIMLKLENDSIVKLKNLEYQMTCRGCGAIGLAGSNAQGINTTYKITKEQINRLSKIKIVKVRLYTSDGYIEEDIKPKHSQKMLNTFLLMENFKS